MPSFSTNLTLAALQAGNYTAFNPSNPTGTTSTAAVVMMGLGSTIAVTPNKSGKILVFIFFSISNGTAGDGAKYDFRYGTGTAPINGAAATGTAFNANAIQMGDSPVGTAQYPASMGGYATLTVGTAYWFDIALAAITAGTASIGNVYAIVIEATN